jgi:uncharacterized protein (DUF1778 family)
MPLNAERRRALTSTYKPRMKEFINVNIRISRVQREYFEEAAEIAGFKSLNDFILVAVSEKADTIMQNQHNWFASENDKQTFFNAIVNPPAPNARLTQAMKRHNEFNRKKY